MFPFARPAPAPDLDAFTGQVPTVVREMTAAPGPRAREPAAPHRPAPDGPAPDLPVVDPDAGLDPAARGRRTVPRRATRPVRAWGGPTRPAPAAVHGVLPRPIAISAARDAVRRSRAGHAAAHRGRASGADRRPGGGGDVRTVPVPLVPAAHDRQDRHDRHGNDRRPYGGPEPTGGERTGPEGERTAETSLPGRSAGLRLALTERLPLWVRLRCGVEPRTLLALGVVLLIAVGFAVHHFWTGRPQTVRAPQAAADGSAAPPVESRPGGSPVGAGPGRAKRVTVDVSGDVRKPGVHRLPSGSRVADALEAAGGAEPGTETGALNKARVLVDGEQIVVGGAGAPATGPQPTTARGSPAPGDPAAPSGTGAGDGGGGARISLNSATAEQLEELPGVGPVLARHIIDYRTQNGGFTSVDQLREVNGIGDARFADIEPRVGP
ncbi:helix-hairpin-helix domain-containing protein [Streptomyces sp. NPDC054784]